jgi:hypothetical protein
MELYRGLQLCRELDESRIVEYETYLELLIDYIKTAYVSTTQRLNLILKDGVITYTYNLLWALFKPNTLVYTKCFSTGKLRYDFREQ